MTMTYVIMTILAVTIATVSMTPIFAEHDLPEDNPFNSGTQSVCYDIVTLDTVTVNGSDDNGLLLADEADKSRQMVDATDMTVSHDSQCNTGDNRVGGGNLAYASRQGVELEYNIGDNDQYSKIYINNLRDWSTSSTCGLFQDLNPEYVFNHEFGHFAGLDHTENWWTSNNHSLMKPSCSSEYDDLKTDDITQINGIY